MRFRDLSVAIGRLRGMVASVVLAGCLAMGAAACGEGGSSEDPAPAETGTEVSGDQTTTSSATPDPDAADDPADDRAESSPVDDEAAIVMVLEDFLAGKDPAAACNEAVTERFLRRAYGDAAGCEAALKSAKPANDAGVSQVVINPDSLAQARAKPMGGIYDAQELRAELVLDDTVWKLDSLRSNVPVGP